MSYGILPGLTSAHPDYQKHLTLIRSSTLPWRKSWNTVSEFALAKSKKESEPVKMIATVTTHIHSITNRRTQPFIQMAPPIKQHQAGAACILPHLSARIRIHGLVSSTQTKLISMKLALQHVQTEPSPIPHHGHIPLFWYQRLHHRRQPE